MNMRWKWFSLLFFMVGLLLFAQSVWAAKAVVEAEGVIPTLLKHTSNVSLATTKIYYYDDVERKNKPWAKNNQPVTIWLPEDVTYVKVPEKGTLEHYAAIENDKINLNFITAGESFLTVSVTDGVYPVEDVGIVMYFYFNQEGYSNVNIGEISGNLKVLVEAPGTVFNLKDCTVGKTTAQGVSIESRGEPVISSDTTNAKAGQIKIFENHPGAVKAGNEIILTASKGVIFAKVEFFPYLGWKKDEIEVQPIDLTAEGLSRVKLKVKKDTSALDYGGAMLLDIWYDVPSGFTGEEIKVTLVRTGEVVVTGDNEVVNAKVGNFGVEISADDPATASIFVGRTGTAATILLEEGKAGSLIQNRTIKFTLPDGITWNDRPATVVTTGNIKLDSGIVSSDKRTVTFKIITASTSASTIEFCDSKYDVEPDVLPGGVTVTVGGSAGASGEVVNAEVCAPFTVTAEKTEVKIGLQNQEAGTITITETKEKAFMKESPTRDGKIILTTPVGITISNMPKVTVTEGNVKINQEGIYVEDLGKKSRLTIDVTEESTEVSAIEISGLKYTLSRVVPEGDIVITLSGSAMHTIEDKACKVANAICVTPASPAGKSLPVFSGILSSSDKNVAQFIIGKTNYLLDDKNYSMDVASYIKNGRTYVPVRHLAYALGLTPQNIMYNAASRQVTLYKDTTKVKLAIESKKIQVNDQQKTMDVAAEINKGRTMLPARWVAEAFGARVGWNKEKQTVTIMF